MLPIRTIVHPTDFSANSQCAWEMACALARDYGARLLLVHVEPPLPSFAELGAVPPEPFDRRALERKLAQIKPTDSNVTVVARTLLDGDEASEINRFAEENHADLIVMGTHGRTGLGRLLMGSVAESVLRQAPCPVLTIKTPPTLHAEVQEICESAVSI
jgi:nucleotide-binding universal stress UspA family protein